MKNLGGGASAPLAPLLSTPLKTESNRGCQSELHAARRKKILRIPVYDRTSDGAEPTPRGQEDNQFLREGIK